MNALNLPNRLTIARMALALLMPFIFIAIPRPLADTLVLIIFILAAVTDWLDGLVARMLGQMSALGRMLDPVADKVLVALSLITLMAISSQPWLLMPPAAAILLREFVISGLREFVGGDRQVVAVTPLAKWKTAIQLMAIAALFAGGGIGAGGGGAALYAIFHMAGTVMLWASAALAIKTGIDYLRAALPQIEEG